jgi:hypothetical protein
MGYGNMIMGGAAALGGAAGAKGGSKQGGIPKWVKRQAKLGFGNLNAAASRPASEAIAPQNEDQLKAYQMARDNIGLGAQDYATIKTNMAGLANGVTSGNVDQWMNPYRQNVIDTSVANIERSRDRNLLQIRDQAEKASAFGGDREAVASALANEDYNRNIATTTAGLYDQGWQQAVEAAFRNQAAAISGNQAYSGATDAQRRAAGGDVAALASVGDVNRSYAQSLLDYPLEMAKTQINAAGGFAGVPNAVSSGGGAAGAMAGMTGGLGFGQSFLQAFPGLK